MERLVPKYTILFVFYSKEGEPMRERDFQRNLVKDLRCEFPGSIVMKTDPTYIQGIPDLVILYEDKWASLECKQKKPTKSKYESNQPYYVDLMNNMSFSRTIFPENKEEVMNELREHFEL